MRHLLKTLFVALFVVATVGFANAQAPKFGHIDLQALIQIMPERATSSTKYDKFVKELEDQMGVMQDEYTKKLEEYTTKRDSVSDFVRAALENDLQDLSQRIQNYQQVAQQQMQAKQNELLAPIFKKAEDAVAEVGKEQGLLYVFDIGSRVVLYKSNASVDVLPLVKAKTWDTINNIHGILKAISHLVDGFFVYFYFKLVLYARGLFSHWGF